ncbi:hypothetical protein HHI36_020685 [Cryptolaemus montrouzieri]|uniref:Secreted protein n=1 Tax=Cryptolaemus montrouzieri TaxID=559131 RepID=A0ABD2NCM2_9CUCU
MLLSSGIIIYLTALFAAINQVSAFFWSSSETTQHPYFLYQRRMPATYNMPYNEPSIPAVPMQVPLQAQLAPQPTIQNVQLVPCLCPISNDFDYDKPQQENVFLNSAHVPASNNLNGQRLPQN